MSLLGETWRFLTDPASWSGPRGLGALLLGHLRLSVLATLAGALVAIPLGIFFGRRRRGGAVASTVVNIGRALPTFAVLVLAFSVFSSWGRGLSIWPSLVALTLLAVPPMFTNTSTGVRDVDPEVVEAARGMGMSERDVLRRVQLPVARPLLLTGLRVAAVQVAATATLGAWVGYACLGTLIFEGFAQQDDVKILSGAVLVAALTIVTELAFSFVERRLTPWARPRRVRDPVEPLGTTAT